MVSGRHLLGFGVAVASMIAVLAAAARAEEAAVPSFTNLAGESCRMVPRGDVPQDPGTPPAVNIVCGQASHASAALSLLALPLALPVEPTARHKVIETAVTASPVGREARSRMACRSGKWLDLAEGRELFVQPCTLIDGDWPYVIAIMPQGRFLAYLDGLPVNLGLFEAAAGRLAEQDATAPVLSDVKTVRGVLDAVFDGKPSMLGSGELDHFTQLVEDARLQNSRKDFRAAEDDYRQALLIEEKAQGPEAPGIGGLLLELALEVSNQEHFDEAAALFHRADPIIQQSPNPGDQARYFSYLALDAANAGRFSEGLAYARQASGIWRDMAESDSVNLDQLGDGAASRSAARGELAHSLNTLAALALHTGDLSDGEAAAKEALDIIGADSGLPPWWRPETLITIGRIYAALGQLATAEQSFRGALVFQQRLFGE
ncbi:MAG TPA: tetratricopeptide repeat protein, partial [Patescibacteria group bacterium]|nr:tetratricopeptide repeat protein [Patescibacteria group bacterium]